MTTPYDGNKKINELVQKALLIAADLHVIGDSEADFKAKFITQEGLENTIANSTNFVDQLLAFAYFITSLANNTDFISALTSNTAFQTNVNNFITGGGGGGGSGAGGSISQVFNFDDFVDDGSGNGIASFLQDMPLTSVPIGVVFEFLTGFDVGATMKVLDSQAHNKTIGALVGAHIATTEIGESDGAATFNWTTTPNPVVVIPALIPTVGSVRITIVYGAGNGGVIVPEVAANDLTAGDPVGVSDMVGDSVDVTLRDSLTHTIPDFQALKGGGVQIGTNLIFIVYQDSSSGDLMGVACTTNKYGMVITAGTPVVITASGGFISGSAAVCSHRTRAVTVAYANGSTIVAKACTVTTGTVIDTPGTGVVAYTDASQINNPRVCKVDTNKILVSSNGSTRANYAVATVSGTTISAFGTKVSETGNFVINSVDGVFYELQFVSAGVVLQGGISDIDVSGGSSNHFINFGARIITVSGTVPTLNTVNVNPSGVFYLGGAGTNKRGNIQIISAGKAVFCVGVQTSNSSLIGYYPVFCDFTGTTISNLINDFNDSTISGGSSSNVWASNGKVFAMLNSAFMNNSVLYSPIVQYTYTGGGSFSLDGNASMSDIFGELLIIVSDYIIAFSGSSDYLMSGISTLSFLGYIARDVSAGESALVMIAGEDRNQSGLIPGRIYQASDNGTLIPYDGAFEFYAGKATSATSIVNN